MELNKKTTILFPQQLHDRLARLARQRGISLGELVRSACERQYGLFSEQERLEALDELSGFELPVADPGTMKRESSPSPADLMP